MRDRNIADWPWFARLPYQFVAAFVSVFALPGAALAISLLIALPVILIAAGAIWALTAAGWIVGQAWPVLWAVIGAILGSLIVLAPFALIGAWAWRSATRHWRRRNR